MHVIVISIHSQSRQTCLSTFPAFSIGWFQVWPKSVCLGNSMQPSANICIQRWPGKPLLHYVCHSIIITVVFDVQQVRLSTQTYTSPTDDNLVCKLANLIVLLDILGYYLWIFFDHPWISLDSSILRRTNTSCIWPTTQWISIVTLLMIMKVLTRAAKGLYAGKCVPLSPLYYNYVMFFYYRTLRYFMGWLQQNGYNATELWAKIHVRLYTHHAFTLVCQYHYDSGGIFAKRASWIL